MATADSSTLPLDAGRAGGGRQRARTFARAWLAPLLIVLLSAGVLVSVVVLRDRERSFHDTEVALANLGAQLARIGVSPIRLAAGLSILLLSAFFVFYRRSLRARAAAEALASALEIASVVDARPADLAPEAVAIAPAVRDAIGLVAPLAGEHGPVAGTGLGLSLSKAYVEAMGGSLDVDSAPGRGSTFSVTLARAYAPSAMATSARRRRAHGVTAASGKMAR